VKASSLEPERIKHNLSKLAEEGFIIKKGRSFCIP